MFKASTLVKWLLVQALATSREQAVPLCEAMRRQLFLLQQPGRHTPVLRDHGGHALPGLFGERFRRLQGFGGRRQQIGQGKAWRWAVLETRLLEQSMAVLLSTRGIRNKMTRCPRVSSSGQRLNN